MLTVTYKLQGLSFNELWFSPRVPLSSKIFLGFYCYRDSRVKIDRFGLKKEEKYTLVNNLSLAKEKLFSQFKSNVRNEIRKSEKIENFRHHSDTTSKEQFLEFYRRFANAKSLPCINVRAIDKYGENLFYVSAYLDGELTNMQVYLVDKEGELVRLLHSISTLHDVDSSAVRAKIGWINRYLHWETMLHFKALSFKTFDWGGYNNGVDAGLAGIDKFKASFGGEKIQLFDYYSYPYFLLKLLREKFL